MKVYCKDCKWFRTMVNIIECGMPAYLLSIEEMKKYKTHHGLLKMNENNDCKNYKRKWYKF
jgi:predicted transcriptional regulator